MSKPKKEKQAQQSESWKKPVEALILAAKGYEAYETLKPLLSAVWEGLKLGVESVSRLAKTNEPAADFERQGIALGIVFQVLRELRMAQLPSADYEANDMLKSISHAVMQMIEAEEYTAILPKIEITALKQKFEAALPSNVDSEPIHSRKL